jgi:hypothetical protein
MTIRLRFVFVGARYIVPGADPWRDARHPPRINGPRAVILSGVCRFFSFIRRVCCAGCRQTQSKNLSWMYDSATRKLKKAPPTTDLEVSTNRRPGALPAAPAKIAEKAKSRGTPLPSFLRASRMTPRGDALVAPASSRRFYLAVSKRQIRRQMAALQEPPGGCVSSETSRVCASRTKAAGSEEFPY